jgi:steroid 5-alpha reductase family enzyme
LSIVLSILTAIAIMSIAWVCFVFFNNLAIVDLFWPICITAVCLIFFLFSHQSFYGVAVFSLITLWMLRLTGYLLLTRILPGHKDKRYESMSTTAHSHKVVLSFFTVFLLQACLAWVVGFSFFYVPQVNSISIFFIIGITMMSLGLLGEAVADWQLSKHKKTTNHLCDKGFWAFSRHPNLFFDWLFWLGVAMCGVSSQLGWIGLLSPVCLYLIMNGITIPITEKHSLKSRGETYMQYKKKVSCFFPWPPKSIKRNS